MPTQVLASFPPLLGYLPREHIASGGQSNVYRALNPKTDQLAALKVVPLVLGTAGERDAAAVQAKAKQLVREMRIHETLQHRNILRLFGGETREGCEVLVGGGGSSMGDPGRTIAWPAGLYMVLDLADGGDLFDKIAPDVGLEQDIAHLYFKQLISGLKYLNHHGICHRDVKPENCLLDGQGNLKVSDFGLATVFKYKGQERLLKDRCGSPPYAAPELARAQAYAAEPIDVWSAGVVLFALLFGNTPWDEPTTNSPEFSAYLSSQQTPSTSSGLRPLPQHEPWTRLPADSAVAQLLLQLLTIDPAKRPKLGKVERCDWYQQPNPLLDSVTGLVADPALLVERLLRVLRSHDHIGPPAEEFQELMEMASSQQAPSATQAALSQAYSQRGLNPTQTFANSLAYYSRLSMAPTQRTNPNLTRFFTTQPLPVLLSILTRALDQAPLASPKNGSKPYKLIYSSPSSSSPNDPPAAAPPMPEEIQAAPLGTLLSRFRIRTVDKRGQRLWVGFHISKSVLPYDPAFDPAPATSTSAARASRAPPRASQAMDLDSDSDDDEEEQVEEPAGQDGFDVVCYKREADPLEMKRLWREVMKALPEGVVVSM